VLFTDPDAPGRVRDELDVEATRAGFDRPADAFAIAVDGVARAAN